MRNLRIYYHFCIAITVGLLSACEPDELAKNTVDTPSPLVATEVPILANQVGADGTGAYYTGNRDIDARHEGVTFTNATFADGATIFNTRNVTFVNCTFRNTRGWGVRFRKTLDTDDTDGVEFINCRFTTSRFDNMNISRDDSIADRVLHKNVRVEGSYFEGWGTENPVEQRAFYHAIYAKCPNVTIDRCEFNSTVADAGHAVSLRSSARVTNNVFRQSERSHPAISYTPKNLSGTPDKGWDDIRIQNNLIYGGRQSVRVGMIHLETQLNEDININNLISTMVLRFNTIALLPGGESENVYISAIRINRVLLDVNMFIYGNLLVDGRNNPALNDLIKEKDRVDYLSNNVESTDLNEHFVDWQNGDFRLKAGSSAIGAANDETNYIVPVDLAGNTRSQGNADAGAYMYSGSSSAANPLTVRAKGDCGDETMELRIDGEVVQTWQNVATTLTDYTYEGFAGGEVSVHFVSDRYDEAASCSDSNLQVDYVQVCGTAYQTEEVATETSTCCQEDADKLYTNGNFHYGNLACGA